MSATAPVREQLAAARAGSAIYAHDDLALVRVAGRDAARLLQNVVTSDIDALAVGEGQYGLALTPKGKPLADAWIVREADDAFVCACEAVAQDDLIAKLKRYRLASRADIAVVTGERSLLERPLAAPGGGLARRPARRAPAGRRRRGARGLGRGARRRRRARSAPRRARRCASSRACRATASTSTAASLPAEAGVVERAISFTKGCYVGQEPIVRLAHRGHANRELRRLHLAEAPALPATLLDGEREVGRITSSAGLPEGGAAALGYVRRTVADGAALIALDARGRARCRLGTLVEWPQGARSSGDRAQPCGG